MEDYPVYPAPKIKNQEALRKLHEWYGKKWTLPRSSTKEEIDAFMWKLEAEREKLRKEAFE